MEAKNYVEQFSCHLKNGEHALLENGTVTIVPKETMRDVYLERLPDDIKKWYTKKNVPKQLICDVMKPQVGDTFINTAPRLYIYSK